MEKNMGLDTRRTAIKIAIISAVSLLLPIPLSMIRNIIEDLCAAGRLIGAIPAPVPYNVSYCKY